MTLADVSNRLKCDFFQRRHVCQSYVKLFLKTQELLDMLLFHRNDLALDRIQAFLQKLEEFSRIVMESAAFVRVMIEELQQVDFYVIVESRVTLHNDAPHLVHIILFEERADIDHEFLQPV